MFIRCTFLQVLCVFGRLNLYTLILNSETDGQEKDVEPTYDAYDANIQPVIEEEAGEKNDQQGMY